MPRYQQSLPVFSVDTTDEAAALIEHVAHIAWMDDGAPHLVVPVISGDIMKQMNFVNRTLERVYKWLVKGVQNDDKRKRRNR